jgi:thiol-disulfide isomerase/thioredoxin
VEERLLIAFAVALAGVVAYLGLRLAHRARLARRAPALPAGWKTGVPGVLYFASRTCAPCRTQGRAVERLGDSAEGINVVKVDVDEERELAEAWSVLTVPTTVVVDGEGRARTINHGSVPEERLRRQLEGVA